MKRFLATLIILVLATLTTNAQNNTFGLSGGYLGAYARVTEDSGSASTSDSGFYLGLYYNLGLNEKIFFMPALDYGAINGNGFGFLSLRAGYRMTDNFNIQAGPQISYLLQDTTPTDINKAGIDLGLGLGYEITNHFNLHARYSFELSNRVKEFNQNSDLKARFNWLFIGLGYSF
ncbi:outer membrane beta-barrel protein [Maribacter sp. R86514]|uniref:outer membrane beta-barrel protein n=1 Tax=Maribacter sp. R86514 TaxID=3093854 RepID=UPI0037CAD930